MEHLQAFPLPNHAPQPVDGHLPIQPWLQQRLISQFNPQTRTPLEYSLYGVVNALLSEQFPLHRKFLVKPQGALRKTIDAFVLAPAEPNTSGGSSSSTIPLLADFIVVRAHEQLCEYWVLCIVEVKREGFDLDTAEEQLLNYLNRARKERLRIGIIRGFLIIGSRCFAYRFDATQQDAGMVEDDIHDLGDTHGPDFKQALFRIARKYWGEVDAVWRANDFVGPFEL